jgi:DNA replication licensing factor MCM7
LQNYKSTQTDLDLAVQDLNIDGDNSSDEYDMLDDVTGGKDAGHPNGQYKEPKRKYMEMLQKVADREIDEVTIELDDLDNVCGHFSFQHRIELTKATPV